MNETFCENLRARGRQTRALSLIPGCSLLLARRYDFFFDFPFLSLISLASSLPVSVSDQSDSKIDTSWLTALGSVKITPTSRRSSSSRRARPLLPRNPHFPSYTLTPAYH